MPTDVGPLASLDSAECRRLLATRGLGRLAYTDGAMPAIVPVRFTLTDGAALIPARLGSPLVAGVRGSVVALQADSFRDDLGPGWSVTAVGPSRVLTDARAVARISDLDQFAGPRRGEDCCISVQLGVLRGWRTGPPRAWLYA